MRSTVGIEWPKHLNQRWAVINHNTSINTAFHFQLSQPSGQLSAFVQGIWSASVPQSSSVVKPLYSDAGSGIIFNLSGEITIGEQTLPEGVIMLPINKRTANIALLGGAQLAGIRLHPGVGYGVLGKHYEKPTLLLPEEDQLYNLYSIHSGLKLQKESSSQIEALHLWASNNIDFNHTMPDSLEKALEYIEQDDSLNKLSENITLSQRQIERLFKLWLGVTPKHYQRILRIKKTICFLRENKTTCLASVAQQFGFSDQAHMTREFRAIACITPGQV